MIKLNIQLFGAAAKNYDKTDENPKDNFMDVRIGAHLYSIPNDVLTGIRAGVGKNPVKAKNLMFAAYYAAYVMSNGEIPKQVSTDIYGTVKDWVESEGGSWDIDASDVSDVIRNMPLIIDANSGFNKRLKSALTKGSFKIDDVDYKTWKQTQPKFKPGYDEVLGAPIGKSSTGDYVYVDAQGSYVYTGGTPIEVNFTGVDTKGVPIRYDANSKTLINSTTGDIYYPESSNALTRAQNDFNMYYKDLYSRAPGTLGADIYENAYSLFSKEAANAATMADASIHAQAMAQAQSVKQLTDNIKAERMAQLRAGMSASQLADRELQMLMGSTSQFNQQAMMANQEKMAAQLGANTAREQAFNQYIEQSTALGQNAAANYASQAGDIMAQARAYQAEQAVKGSYVTLENAIKLVSGQNKPQ